MIYKQDLLAERAELLAENMELRAENERLLERLRTCPYRCGFTVHRNAVYEWRIEQRMYEHLASQHPAVAAA